jgi:CDP-diacylglycerol--serine O-phosphatidyltransferase
MVLNPTRPRLRRPEFRQVVVVVPSAFTLGNLFFGFWAMVSAARGNFMWAAWCVVFAGVLDMLDGRVARLSGTGTRFGAELDSLVDCTSFGVAPAMIMYFLEFQSAGKFAWLICFIYVVAVAVRLARYNVQHSTGSPGWFTGMPSPSAGMTLAVYYPFSTTEWYQRSLAYLNLQRDGLTILMILLSLLMVSTVKYPRFPPIGFRTFKGVMGMLLHALILVGSLWAPEHFLFPLGITYLVFGVARHLLINLGERPGDGAPPVEFEEPEEPASPGSRRTLPRLVSPRRTGET